MSKKEWEIIEEQPDKFLLARGMVFIHFDEIVNDVKFWRLYQNYHIVAELSTYDNTITNIDDVIEEIRQKEVRK